MRVCRPRGACERSLKNKTETQCKTQKKLTQKSHKREYRKETLFSTHSTVAKIALQFQNVVVSAYSRKKSVKIVSKINIRFV